VRRDIDALEIVCVYKDAGCDWEGTFAKLEVQLQVHSYFGTFYYSCVYYRGTYQPAIMQYASFVT